MLRILVVAFLARAGEEVISWCSRVVRMGFVPVVSRPHLEARSLRWVSLRVGGRLKVAIHVGFG